jgi:hypothetical protein
MEANSTDQKTFQLTENGQQLGTLTYESLFLLKAEIRLEKGEHYEIKALGFFGTTITVTKNGSETANLKMNWRGQIVLAFYDGQEFVLKAKGIFGNKFVIENKEEKTLIQFDPKFNWRKFHYNYDITYDEKPHDILLVLLGVYAANYFIASMSGAS